MPFLQVASTSGAVANPRVVWLNRSDTRLAVEVSALGDVEVLWCDGLHTHWALKLLAEEAELLDGVLDVRGDGGTDLGVGTLTIHHSLHNSFYDLRCWVGRWRRSTFHEGQCFGQNLLKVGTREGLGGVADILLRATPHLPSHLIHDEVRGGGSHTADLVETQNPLLPPTAVEEEGVLVGHCSKHLGLKAPIGDD
jgi:hypothetical protein